MVATSAEKPVLFMIPQTHSPVQHGGQITDDVVASQIKIAAFLSALPSDTVVFSEDSFGDSTSPTVEDLEEVLTNLDKEMEDWCEPYYRLCLKLARDKETSFETLSKADQALVAKVGATATLNATGKIRKLYKVVPSVEVGDAQMEKIEKLIAEYGAAGRDMMISDEDPLYKLMNTDRERWALNEVKNYFKSHPESKQAFIVFGAGHDFRRHQKLYSGFDIRVHPKFVTDTHFWEDTAKETKK